MSDSNHGLDHLLARYREITPDLDPGAGFMPMLWERIEARRSFAWKLRLYARSLVSVVAAVCLAVTVFQFSPLGAVSNPIYQQTYLETLTNDNAPETLAYAGVVLAEPEQ
ncbi:MAG: hypothetical protein JJE04_09150 [Acidobacteriia bacterium]|nr:hypothetical protein [Terriglobia bacterium]